MFLNEWLPWLIKYLEILQVLSKEGILNIFEILIHLAK